MNFKDILKYIKLEIKMDVYEPTSLTISLEDNYIFIRGSLNFKDLLRYDILGYIAKNQDRTFSEINWDNVKQVGTCDR